MPNRSSKRRYLSLAVLTALAILAFIISNPFRETVDEAIRHYRSRSPVETENVGDMRAGPSQGEMAHNENYFGEGRMEEGDYGGAIEKFSSAVELDPENPNYHANLAMAYEKIGQHGNAIDQLRVALTFQPDNAEFYTWLGDAYFGNEQWQDAAEAYDSALAHGANDHLTYFSAAQAYLESGPLIKAMGAIDSAIELNPRDPDYYRVSGMIKSRFQRYEDAMRDFETARKMDPGDRNTDEWIKYVSDGLRDGNWVEEAYGIEGPAGVAHQGSDDPRQKKLDEIYERMERLKEQFRRKSR